MTRQIAPDELGLLATESGLLLPPALLEEALARHRLRESPDEILAALRRGVEGLLLRKPGCPRDLRAPSSAESRGPLATLRASERAVWPFGNSRDGILLALGGGAPRQGGFGEPTPIGIGGDDAIMDVLEEALSARVRVAGVVVDGVEAGWRA